MAIEVVLDALSGRPNPTWTLNQIQEAEFLSRVEKLLLRPLVEHRATAKPPVLGYRGFEVRDTDQRTLPSLMRVYGGVARQGPERYEDRNRELEHWLLNTASPFVDERLMQSIRQELEH